MNTHIKVKPIRNFVKEYDDPRQMHHALQEQKNAFSRLDLIKKKREQLDIDIEKLNIEMSEFKKYVHVKSLKAEDYIDTIDECENIIRNEKMKQEDYQKKIKSISINIKKLERTVQDARSRIISYKPYEKFISKVIAKNPRYENVYDIIKHVEEMACIRNIGSALKVSDFNEKEKTNNDSLEKIQHKKIKNKKITLNVHFNEPRTYLDELKKADLQYIKKKANIKSEYTTKIHLNPVNQIYLNSNLDIMKEKHRFSQLKDFQNEIQEREKENNFVFSSILHQYRELFLKNNGKLPTEFPTAEEQLTYIFNFYKTLVKRFEIYENLISGKKSVKDYISETKNQNSRTFPSNHSIKSD
ncbi:uncharacterized protein LOC112602359 [Melanaphis sacchari]|uniref:uncharacterized protein LOC112602359 n=1 Tax=Melanaphis sacchari TaxID=742174 RepID=UPI000DC15192|nr:uncharacterized protein LOC112602359 [Melanaphis sacchari]